VVGSKWPPVLLVLTKQLLSPRASIWTIRIAWRTCLGLGRIQVVVIDSMLRVVRQPPSGFVVATNVLVAEEGIPLIPLVFNKWPFLPLFLFSALIQEVATSQRNPAAFESQFFALSF
jgi:hypothetical protein